MQKYGDILGYARDTLNGREEIEWSNFWYDNATNGHDDRILLIGDSTARQIRSELARTAHKPVDLLATSSGLHDALFVAQMDAFFAQETYRYKVIFVQLGHHSRIGDLGEAYHEKDYVVFYDDFKKLISFLTQYTEKIIIASVFYSVITPRTKMARLLRGMFRMNERYDEVANEIKERKNQILKRVADELQLEFFDINQFMYDRRKKYLHSDHIHFESSAKKVIVEQYLKYVNGRGIEL
ncbi:MAG: hypothetical protein IJ833_02220 [Lachnospiraceae bacterium]|nr:hypothetical protein [Lachnospiraceae bacterium]